MPIIRSGGKVSVELKRRAFGVFADAEAEAPRGILALLKSQDYLPRRIDDEDEEPGGGNPPPIVVPPPVLSVAGLNFPVATGGGFYIYYFQVYLRVTNPLGSQIRSRELEVTGTYENQAGAISTEIRLISTSANFFAGGVFPPTHTLNRISRKYADPGVFGSNDPKWTFRDAGVDTIRVRDGRQGVWSSWVSISVNYPASYYS